ncbi:hypothetical protein [Velocimicrobium porci]|uniref:Uncharacterized protein n=1 Tax=Velocimicrobium porci TaxID=2606634 RepID=A0A6L5Y089_9FIRM|nr:hypothetical protein [Velocimicrobium porci]MSS63848.1 hypothetical protein [Velocimicrobium porci]
MKKLVKIIKENHLIIDVLNVLLGLVLIVTVVLFCMFPGNKIVIGLMILLSGFMNIGNGIKRYQSKRTRGTGMALMTVGACILIIGIYILNLL